MEHDEQFYLNATLSPAFRVLRQNDGDWRVYCSLNTSSPFAHLILKGELGDVVAFMEDMGTKFLSY